MTYRLRSTTAPPAAFRGPTRHLFLRARTGLAMATGAALLAWSAGIHLDLWSSGYRSLPTIGWLFLLQAVTGFAFAVVVAAARRALPALAGALFLASTIGGFVWSVEWGLFGFQDSLSAPFAAESLGVEAAGVAVLLGAAALRRRDRRHRASA